MTKTGQLVITFSEPLNGTVHYDRLHVHDSGQSAGGATVAGVRGKSLAGATLTIAFTDARRGSFDGTVTVAQVDIDQGAVSDLAGNEIGASVDNPIRVDDHAVQGTDNTPPIFTSAVYTTGDGTLSIRFSEPLSGTADLSKLHVRDSGQSAGGATLTGAAQSVAGSTLTVTLTLSHQAAVESLGTPQLDIDAGAVSDLNSNEIAASPDNAITVDDTTPPVPTITSTAGRRRLHDGHRPDPVQRII